MFRAEAVQAQRSRGTGEILLSQGVSSILLTILFAVIAAGIIVFIILAPVTRKEAVSGVVTPSKGLIRIIPMRAGIIMRQEVQDGQEVRAGDVLFVLSSERSSSTHGDADLAVSGLIEERRRSLVVDQSQLRLQNEERSAVSHRKVQDLQTEQERIDKQMLLQNRRVEIAQQMFARYQDLQRENFVSSAQAEDHQADLIDQQQRLADLQRAKASGIRDLVSAQSEIKQIELQMQRDDEAALRGQALLSQDLTENEAQRELTIRAPKSGIIATTSTEVGQPVLATQLLATIVPTDSTLEAELYVPSRSISFVKVGMPVLLRYEGFPYQKFGQFKGMVSEVSKASIKPEEMSGVMPAVTAGGEPIYKLKVKLGEQTVQAYGKQTPLRPGMTLEASLVIERRHLYEWVLDPLYSVTGRI